MNPRKADSRAMSTRSSWWAASMTWSVCCTHRASEVSARTSPTSTSATSALSAAGSTAAWVSSLGTARSGRAKATAHLYSADPLRAFPRGQRGQGSVIRLPWTSSPERSPADVTVLLGRHGWAASQVDRAVDAARAAQPSWAARPPAERTALVRRIGEVLKAREEELARAIALDVGKPLWESRAEVQACVAKAAITVEDGLRLVAPFPAPGQAGAECRFRPLGVLAVLGPFNFPVHLPNGHVLPALACGNAVVFKPSEIAPHAAELYARCLAEAGVPPGVFNLVQGPGPVGAALAAHPGVDGALFTGSWAVGQAIQRACLGQTKMLALEMGGKNAALVLRDADLDKAVYDAVFSAFVSAGQRCTAASRLIVEGPPARADALAARIAAAAQRLSIGHPLRDGVFMGPLASEAALAKFLAGVSKAAETVLEPRPLSPGGLRGSYVTPGVHRVRERKGSAYEREELFGPDLAVYDAATADEAVAIANATDYGLAASVHTASREAF